MVHQRREMAFIRIERAPTPGNRVGDVSTHRRWDVHVPFTLKEGNLRLDRIEGEAPSGSKKLEDVDGYQPASGVSETPITGTTKEYESLRLNNLSVEEEGLKLIVKATTRYKPGDEDEYDIDGDKFIETNPIPVMEFVGLSEGRRNLIREYIELVNDTGKELRKQAAKTITLQDRLTNILLPEYESVADGVQRYVERKKQASELTEKLEALDALIDDLVYDLYGLTDEEIETVESVALD